MRMLTISQALCFLAELEHAASSPSEAKKYKRMTLDLIRTKNFLNALTAIKENHDEALKNLEENKI